MARILVVEDDAAVRNFMQRAIQMEGHEVTALSDGAEAWQRLGVAREGFDLVVTDVRMPGMDGVALAEAMAKGGLTTPILYTTGFALDREQVIGTGAHIVKVVIKPMSLDRLRAEVRDALGSASPQLRKSA